jgi:hypothetical protein
MLSLNLSAVTKLNYSGPVRAIIEESKKEEPSAGLSSLGTDEELARRILSGEFSADDGR